MLNRRSILGRSCAFCAGAVGLFTGKTASAQADQQVLAAPLERLARPALDTDEGGLWAMMDREETRLRRSSFLVKDQKLNQYLQNIACKLGGSHCPDIRVSLVRTPWFNASMAPNGMMQIWTGLLLRMENEAQLAAILGHEIGHYLERHSLHRLRDLKSRAAVAQFLGLFGAVGAAGSLGLLAGSFSFSREHETQADVLGMRLMQASGYDGKQAAQVWENVLSELKVRGGEDIGKRSAMMATHPPSETRRDDLLKLAGDVSGQISEKEFNEAIAPHSFGWMADEIKRGQYEESLVLFGRLIKNKPRDANLHYARGEVYRLRNTPDDGQLALEDLSLATSLPLPPALSFRSLGLIQKQRADKLAAAKSFEKYLAAAPQAADSDLIRQYLSDLAL